MSKTGERKPVNEVDDGGWWGAVGRECMHAKKKIGKKRKQRARKSWKTMRKNCISRTTINRIKMCRIKM